MTADQTRTRPGADPLLNARSLVTRYANGALGLQGLTMQAQANQVTAIIGANGAGKTTLLRSLTGFLRAEGARVIEGSVTLGGREITRLEPHETALAGVVLVPDRNKVFANMTVEANFLAIGPHHSRARQEELKAWALSLFPDLKRMMTRAAGSLSGGQQQMLAIARVLMCEPRVLLLDEMTLGLHPLLRQPLFELLPVIATEGRAVVVVDESIELALANSSYAYVLRKGQVVDEDHSQNMTAARVSHAYVGSQAEAEALS